MMPMMPMMLLYNADADADLATVRYVVGCEKARGKVGSALKSK